MAKSFSYPPMELAVRMALALSPEGWAQLQGALQSIAKKEGFLDDEGGAMDEPPPFKGRPNTGGAMDARPWKLPSEREKASFAKRYPGAAAIRVI